MYPPGKRKCSLVKVWLHGKLRITFKNPKKKIICLSQRTFCWPTGYFGRKKQNCGQSRSSTHKASSMRIVFGSCNVCRFTDHCHIHCNNVTLLVQQFIFVQGRLNSSFKWYSSVIEKLCPTTDKISWNMGKFFQTLSHDLQLLKIGVSQNLYKL